MKIVLNFLKPIASWLDHTPINELVPTIDFKGHTGTVFFITGDGYLISNYHVVKDATKVRLLTGAGLIDAKVVQVDAANDLKGK